MRNFTYLALILFLGSCSPTNYFIVRHAEKESNTMSSDVALSTEGKERAQALQEMLGGHKIRYVYSTNFQRTRATAEPLARFKGLTVQTYDPADSNFVTRIKHNGKGDVLIVGHSNTVDDIVNKLMGENIISDLSESQYGDLFVVQKKGVRFTMEKRHFGK